MTREEIRNRNIAIVFKAILNSNNTIKKIVSTTGLATQTVGVLIATLAIELFQNPKMPCTG